MRESSRPPLAQVDHDDHLAAIVVRGAQESPTRTAFRRRDATAPGGWVDISAQAFLDDVEAVARGLVAAGVAPGDRVALVSRTRYEWTVVDFAIWTAGAVTVPVYETSSGDQVTWVLQDSGARCAVVETPAHAGLVERARGEDGVDVASVWTLDEGGLEELRRLGEGVDAAELDRRRAGLDLDSLATVIYTSGTTGRPKGVELTHGNLRVLAESTASLLHEVVRADDAATLLFLPLAHVFARFIQVLAVAGHMTLGHTPDTRHLAEDLLAFRPTFILSVPRVFEKVYNGAEAKAEAAGRGALFRRAADTAVAWSRAQDTGGAGLRLRLAHALFDRLVYRRLRAAMGGRLDVAVSGGAPLGERLAHFFRGIGVLVLEGYGLTESTAPTACNIPAEQRIGTVGRPLPATAVRIGDDGEIQLRGPNITRGYWRNPQATAEAFVDGWFRTGDLGHLDDDGYLRITGRAKDIIVTAAGKNVAPAALEDRLRAHPLVSQCLVVGDGRPYIGALVTLDTDMLPGWLHTRGLPALSPAEAAEHPEVVAEVQRAVDSANATVSRAESIRRFLVLADDFTEESGQMTPSMKLKRQRVLSDHAGDLERLYS